ncbi:MAG TPA: glycosyltransferase family 2 protein [Bacteroidota bacterium]|jgi:glycosyltransferase involved in cell wall biosynthesis
MNSPIISIITPSYNQGHYLEETILSVITQEGDFSIDYLIMDGGSTDNSVEIIRRYSDMLASGTFVCKCKGVSIRWASEKDKGQSDAINKGITQSHGEILTYINSDDLFSPGAFAHVVKFFHLNPESDFVYGDGDVIDERGETIWEWLSRPYRHSVMLSYHFLWNDFSNYIMQQSTFWRRRAVNRIGLFDASFHYAMDAEYWIRAGDAGLVLSHLREKLGKFRLIRGTKSLSSPTVFWEDYLEIFRKYRKNRGLSKYLAFYYFNLALSFNLDVDRAFLSDRRLFERWNSLEEKVRKSLSRQANRGKSICRLVVANEHRKKNEPMNGAKQIRRVLKEDPLILFHPFGAFYALRYLLSIVGGGRVDRWQAGLASWYRRNRYDYRYHAND